MVPVKRPDFGEIVRRARRLSASKFCVIEANDETGYWVQVDGVAFIAGKFSHREDAEFFAAGAGDVETLVRYALWLEERLGFSRKTAFESEEGEQVPPFFTGLKEDFEKLREEVVGVSEVKTP